MYYTIFTKDNIEGPIYWASVNGDDEESRASMPDIMKNWNEYTRLRREDGLEFLKSISGWKNHVWRGPLPLHVFFTEDVPGQRELLKQYS